MPELNLNVGITHKPRAREACLPGYSRTHHVLLRASFDSPNSSQAEVHADGGKDESAADEVPEALDVEEAAECDDATETEPGPDGDASDRDPLVPTGTRSSGSCGTCHGSALGDADAEERQDYMVQDWEARCRDPKHSRSALTRADRYPCKSSGRLCRLDACLDGL